MMEVVLMLVYSPNEPNQLKDYLLTKFRLFSMSPTQVKSSNDNMIKGETQ